MNELIVILAVIAGTSGAYSFTLPDLDDDLPFRSVCDIFLYGIMSGFVGVSLGLCVNAFCMVLQG